MKRKQKKPKYYSCPVCHFFYKQKAWAEKCKAWCTTHKSCNMDITRYAMEKI